MKADEARAKVPLAVAAAVAAISTAAPVIRLAEPFDPEVIASLRVTVTTIALLGVGLVRGQRWAHSVRTLIASPREGALTLVAGLCLAAHFAAWIASLSLTSVIRSVALVSTTPLIAGLFARVLGDRASWRLYLGALVAIVGTAIMVEVEGSGSTESSAAWIGDLLAASGAVTAALYLLCGRAVQTRLGDSLSAANYFVSVNVVAGVALWVLVLARGVPVAPVGVVAGSVLAVLWLGLIPGIVGHGLFNWAVRRLPVHTVSLATLLEPVGAGLLAWVLLAQGPAGGRSSARSC